MISRGFMCLGVVLVSLFFVGVCLHVSDFVLLLVFLRLVSCGGEMGVSLG